MGTDGGGSGFRDNPWNSCLRGFRDNPWNPCLKSTARMLVDDLLAPGPSRELQAAAPPVKLCKTVWDVQPTCETSLAWGATPRWELGEGLRAKG